MYCSHIKISSKTKKVKVKVKVEVEEVEVADQHQQSVSLTTKLFLFTRNLFQKFQRTFYSQLACSYKSRFAQRYKNNCLNYITLSIKFNKQFVIHFQSKAAIIHLANHHSNLDTSIPTSHSLSTHHFENLIFQHKNQNEQFFLRSNSDLNFSTLQQLFFQRKKNKKMIFYTSQNQSQIDMSFMELIHNLQSHPNYKPTPKIDMSLMPRRLFNAIKQEFDFIVFDQSLVSDYNDIFKVKSIFHALIDDGLLQIKGSQMRLPLLIMLLNNVDLRKVSLLKKRKNVSKAVGNYLKIIDSFDVKSINEAKALLRDAIYRMMNESWIYHKALHTKFKDHERDSQITFEKFMLEIRKQLKNGTILNTINTEQVMEIPSAIVREGF